MKTVLKLSLSLACMASLSACVTTRSYVDPQYRLASPDSVQRLAQPIPVKVVTEFRTNGAPTAAATPVLQRQVEQALLAGGVFAPTSDANAVAIIHVTANDMTDLKDAHKKGVHYGLTFGTSGIEVNDDYEFTVTYRNGTRGDYNSVYKHAIHSTIGDVGAPAGVTPTTTADAFSHVVQDVMLNFTQEAQSKGLTAS